MSQRVGKAGGEVAMQSARRRSNRMPHAPAFASKEAELPAPIRTHQSRGTTSSDAECTKGRVEKRPEGLEMTASLRYRGFLLK